MNRHFTVVVDRFENEQAILQADNGIQIILHHSLLPDAISEGAVLGITIDEDKEAKTARKSSIKRLHDALLKSNSKNNTEH